MSNSEPLVSVLIPAYNVEKYIGKCLYSVYSQNYTNIEVIVVNDRSTDKTYEIINKFKNIYLKNKLRILNLNENRGLANARNIAVENTKGEYLFHLDGDDWLARNDAIRNMVSHALNTKADIIEANYYIVKQRETIEQMLYRDYRDTNKIICDIILKKTSITIWNKLIRTNLYKENKIKVPIEISNGEDYITLPRLIYHCIKIEHIDDFTYCYNQLNINSFSNNRKRNNNLIMTIYANIFLEKFFISKGFNAQIFTRMFFESLSYCFLYSDNPKALEKFLIQFGEKKCSISTFLSMRNIYKIIYTLKLIKSYWGIKLVYKLISMVK